MIELPILGLLKEGPRHGYKLKRRLETIVGYFGNVSYGSLYPMLRKLEERGHVARAVEKVGKRNRIAYQITPEGEARLLDLMRESGTPFALKMLFFRIVPISDRLWLMERQRDEWLLKLKERYRQQEPISSEPADSYRVALLARAIGELERDIPWIENLIEGERQACGELE